MNLKRMNLCFDVDDTKQKKVYDFLQYAGRKKTKTIVNMILKSTAPIFEETEESRKNNKTTSLPEITNPNKDSYSSKKIDEMQAGILQIINMLNLIQEKSTIPQAGATENKKDSTLTDDVTSAPSEEMNEEVFSLMMNMLS